MLQTWRAPATTTTRRWGSSPEATEEEIRRTYRRLALQWHPDRNPGDPRAEERFKEISEAYAVLMDPAKRRRLRRHARSASDARRRRCLARGPLPRPLQRPAGERHLRGAGARADPDGRARGARRLRAHALRRARGRHRTGGRRLAAHAGAPAVGAGPRRPPRRARCRAGRGAARAAPTPRPAGPRARDGPPAPRRRAGRSRRPATCRFPSGSRPPRRATGARKRVTLRRADGRGRGRRDGPGRHARGRAPPAARQGPPARRRRARRRLPGGRGRRGGLTSGDLATPARGAVACAHRSEAPHARDRARRHDPLARARRPALRRRRRLREDRRHPALRRRSRASAARARSPTSSCAPRNGAGPRRVRADFYLLQPVDARRGNGALLLDVPNRGRKVALGMFNSALARARSRRRPRTSATAS